MQQTVDWINGWVWSPALVYLCLLVGLYFSIRTRFMQVRHIGEMVRAMFRGKSSAAGVSSFQALTIALSVAALAITLAYPYAKRFESMPVVSM